MENNGWKIGYFLLLISLGLSAFYKMENNGWKIGYFLLLISLGLSAFYNTQLSMSTVNPASVVGFLLVIASIIAILLGRE